MSELEEKTPTTQKKGPSKAYMHEANIKARAKKRSDKAKKRGEVAVAKKQAKIERKQYHEDQRQQYLHDAKAKQDAFDDAHSDLHEHLEERKTAADAQLEESRSKLKKKMMSKHPPSGHEKRKEMLNILAKNISAKASAAEDRLLLKVDKLIDIIMAYIQQQLQESGLPMIMGIEFLTLGVSLIIDLIPVPEVGLVAEALEAASDGVISGITAVGPGSLTSMIEDKFMPLLIKFANVFQGMAASFTCCPKKNRAPSIKQADKKALGTDLSKLDQLLERVIGELPTSGPGVATAKQSLTSALQQVKTAQQQIASVKTTQGGGRRTRRRRRRQRPAATAAEETAGRTR